MFDLPLEMQLHIFSYLPPVDVRRFHQLNSHFKRLTEERSSFFQQLSISYTIRELEKEKDSEGKLEQRNTLEMEIRTHLDPFKCHIVKKKNSRWIVEIQENKERFEKLFASLPKNSSEDLGPYFSLLFKNANIKLEVDLIMHARIHDFLLDALKNTNSRTERVTFNVTSLETKYRLAQIFKYMEVCSKNGMPELSLKVNPDNYNFSSVCLENFNLVSERYPNLCVDFSMEQFCLATEYFVWTRRQHNPKYSPNHTLRFYGEGGCLRHCFFKDLPGYFTIPEEFCKEHLAKDVPEEIEFEIPREFTVRMKFTKGKEDYVVATIHFEE